MYNHRGCDITLAAFKHLRIILTGNYQVEAYRMMGRIHYGVRFD